MDKVAVVKNFNAYQKSDADRIGFFTFNDEPHQSLMADPLYWQSI